jgi:aldehyde dehydrogenase (NAD+)
VAPDYLLIDRTVKDEFIQLFRDTVNGMYGEKALENPNYGKIINQKHYDRLCGLLDEEKIVYGGEKNPKTLQIAPTVMDNVTEDDPVMKEEIFGPILPVLTFEKPEEAFAFVQKREKPLAAYLFTNSKKTEKLFLEQLSFGGGCINDTIVHLATSQMGFGGVGNSGMGSYHGIKSFQTFSHEKSILKKSCLLDLPLRYQPYSNGKDKMIHMFLK